MDSSLRNATTEMSSSVKDPLVVPEAAPESLTPIHILVGAAADPIMISPPPLQVTAALWLGSPTPISTGPAMLSLRPPSTRVRCSLFCQYLSDRIVKSRSAVFVPPLPIAPKNTSSSAPGAAGVAQFAAVDQKSSLVDPIQLTVSAAA